MAARCKRPQLVDGQIKGEQDRETSNGGDTGREMFWFPDAYVCTYVYADLKCD